MRITPLRFVALSLFGSLVLVGCAQQIGDIDRTGPNRIEKAAFEGEWYIRQTVVDVNATAISSFVGLEGPMERVVFDIEEDYLLAYRTHEDILGIDSATNPEWERGQPVVAYEIQSHFDVQRGYSSSTGEQTNVIAENSSDRHWYEREFIRVNWSQNRIDTDIDPMVSIYDVSGVSISPQDNGDEPTWYVERDANGEAVYIDVLNTYIIQPDWLECVLTFGFPLYNATCGPETITVRTSFMRIEEDDNYIPREYSDWDMNDFGFFRTERTSYDPYYGARDESRIYLAHTWNIWQESTNPDGSVIPYADRDVRPIVYYLSESWPDEYKDVAFEIANDYDNAFRRIVAAHRGVEIPSTPSEMDTVDYDLVPRMFYLCENPGGTESPYEMSNAGYQDGLCQREGTVKEIGDLRYSMFNWILQPQQNGPWGYGPSSADPLTSQIINGNANIYPASMLIYSRYILDLTKIISGELNAEDFGHGRDVDAYFERLRRRNDDDVFLGLVRDSSDRNAAIEAAIENQLADPRVQHILSRNPEEFRMRAGDTNPLERLRGTSLERAAIFPEIEQRLLSPTDREAIVNGTLDPSAPLSATQVHELSLATIGDPIRMLADYNRQQQRFMQHGANNACVFMASAGDPGLMGLAEVLAEEREVLADQGMTIDEIDAELTHTILEGMLRMIHGHELGHTVGLRHNFAGSFDALNFGIEYWRLREQTFDPCARAECLAQQAERENPDPERCELEPITFVNNGFFSGEIAPSQCRDERGNVIDENGEVRRNQEVESFGEYQERSAELLQGLYDNRIHDYQVGSLMDYTGNAASVGWSGLGLYDYAAIAYGYGELREVFNITPHMLHVEVTYEGETDDFDSSTIRRSEVEITTFDDVDIFVIDRLNLEEGDSPAYLREDEIGHEHPYTYYHYSTLPIMFGGDVEAMYDRTLVPQGEVGQRVEVPFRFCSDEYRGAAIECNVWDSGADFLEIFQDTRDGFDEYYFSTFFRRGRAGFGLWLYPVITRMYGRVMAPMTNFYQHWLIRAAGRGSQWYNSDWGGDAATKAAFAALDFLGSIITRPTIGTYYYDEDEDMYINIDDELDYTAPFNFEIEENIEPGDYLSIGADIGRYGFERYRRDDQDVPGYYYFLEPEVLSWFWAKWTAMMALVLPTVNILGQDTASDSTAFSIPPYLIFADELTAFFGALPREDFDILGACVQKGNGRDGARVYQRGLISGAPSGCAGSVALNPYSNVYGNADFNMRLLSVLYGSAYFQTNYSMNWFDQSNVYILGRGYNLEPGEGFIFETFTDDNGLQYAAMLPEEVDPGVDENVFVGVQLVREANAFYEEREAILVETGGNRTGDYWEVHNNLENTIETMRLLNQSNSLFEGWNVFIPFTL
jgi:hypothetical protein